MFVGRQNQGTEIKPPPYIDISFFSILLVDIFSNLSKQEGQIQRNLSKRKRVKKMLCLWWIDDDQPRGYSFFRWVSSLCCFRIFEEEREFMLKEL